MQRERFHAGGRTGFIEERTGPCRPDGVYIPKPDGRQRPLAVAALEDKIVQRATITVLNAFYEGDFLGLRVLQRPRERKQQRDENGVVSCAKDEGRPLGIGFQEQISNHFKLLR